MANQFLERLLMIGSELNWYHEMEDLFIFSSNLLGFLVCHVAQVDISPEKFHNVILRCDCDCLWTLRAHGTLHSQHCGGDNLIMDGSQKQVF